MVSALICQHSQPVHIGAKYQKKGTALDMSLVAAQLSQSLLRLTVTDHHNRIGLDVGGSRRTLGAFENRHLFRLSDSSISELSD
jgi:hypothetical protein